MAVKVVAKTGLIAKLHEERDALPFKHIKVDIVEEAKADFIQGILKRATVREAAIKPDPSRDQ